VRAYDPADGSELWRFRDEAEVKTPSPFAAGGLIVLAGGYRGRPIYALKPGAAGDVSVPEGAASGPSLAWRTEPGGPYTSTPVAYRKRLYAARDEGIFMAHDLETGALRYRERTGGTHSASPVASDGRLYLPTESGEVLVLGTERRSRSSPRRTWASPSSRPPPSRGARSSCARGVTCTPLLPRNPGECRERLPVWSRPEPAEGACGQERVDEAVGELLERALPRATPPDRVRDLGERVAGERHRSRHAENEHVRGVAMQRLATDEGDEVGHEQQVGEPGAEELPMLGSPGLRTISTATGPFSGFSLKAGSFIIAGSGQ
jgi:hypothetical protein